MRFCKSMIIFIGDICGNVRRHFKRMIVFEYEPHVLLKKILNKACVVLPEFNYDIRSVSEMDNCTDIHYNSNERNLNIREDVYERAMKGSMGDILTISQQMMRLFMLPDGAISEYEESVLKTRSEKDAMSADKCSVVSFDQIQDARAHAGQTVCEVSVVRCGPNVRCGTSVCGQVVATGH